MTQAIRDLCRDARNLALVPRAELLLYVAREIQLAEEVVIPGLSRADIVITDRYLYTAEVLARQIRDLPDATIRAIIDDAAGGVWPDMVVLVDVDPSVARGRRKVAKLMAREQRPSSRKGLAGSGLGQRLREGYLSLAAGDPDRWVVVDNTDADLDELVTHICDAIFKARAQGVQAAVASERTAHAGNGARRPRNDNAAPITTAEAALAAFLGWVDDRAQREPTLAAYVLAGLSGPGCRRAPDRARGTGAARDRARPARAVRRRVVAAAAVAHRGGAQRGRDVSRPIRPPRRRRRGRCASCWRRPRRPRWRRACGASTTKPPGRCATSCTTACPTPCWRRWGCSTARAPGAGASAGRANAARWMPPSPPT